MDCCLGINVLEFCPFAPTLSLNRMSVIAGVVSSCNYKIIFGGAIHGQNNKVFADAKETYDPKLDRAGCAHIWSLYASVSISPSAAGPEKYPSRLDEPPGAVGGRYGSGCFHFSNKPSVSLMSS